MEYIDINKVDSRGQRMKGGGMRIIILIGLLGWLFGCETTEYYTNPNSQGYYEQAFGGTCEQCGRAFSISAYQINNVENITCPYDGYVQNTKYAYNRYVYALQQQQQQETQSFYDRQAEIRKEYQRKLEDINRRYSEMQGQRRGSVLDPIYIKTVP
jgi:hypothetical protein